MKFLPARMRWHIWQELTNLSEWLAKPEIVIRLHPLNLASDFCWWLAENLGHCTDEEMHELDREDDPTLYT